MTLHEIALSSYPSYRPDHDEWATPHGQYIQMYGKHQGRRCRWSVHLVGPEGKARQEMGGPLLPGPWGFLVCQATVISARREPRPVVVDVAVGDQLRLRCYAEIPNRAPVLTHVLDFRIADDQPTSDPSLVLLADPSADQR
jgi:hypothetical protein